MTGASMSGSVAVQPDDVRIIRALQVAPRAPFASIAAALGLTEGTINRRYRRLRADGVVRVVGVVNPGALGQSRWPTQLRCRPGSVAAIAGALAKRDDVNWVALGAAGSEVTCATQSRDQAQREELLGQRLPRRCRRASRLRRWLVGSGREGVLGCRCATRRARCQRLGPGDRVALRGDAVPAHRDVSEGQRLAAIQCDGGARYLGCGDVLLNGPPPLLRALHPPDAADDAGDLGVRAVRCGEGVEVRRVSERAVAGVADDVLEDGCRRTGRCRASPRTTSGAGSLRRLPARPEGCQYSDQAAELDVSCGY